MTKKCMLENLSHFLSPIPMTISLDYHYPNVFIFRLSANPA